MIFRILTFLLLVCFQTAIFAQVKAGDVYPEWTTGYMDIHHINTAKGECVFIIMPDGTTMMIDAGETGTDERNFKPNGSRSSGEWISRYILRMMRPLSEKKLDYIFLTHFHGDHMGAVNLSKKKSDNGDYALTGITEVGDLIPFGTIVDRNWPDYDYPQPVANNRNMQNYLDFVKWHIANKGAKAEQFQVGSNQQFKLLKKANQYPDFEIRNIVANGVVWTGVHNNTRSYFPAVDKLPAHEYPGENECSAGIRISYGKFDYFNGGDLVGPDELHTWKNIEAPVGFVTGPVDVCEVNHHAKGAMCETFVRSVCPRVFVIQGFALSHPDLKALQTMMSRKVYPDERDVFIQNLFEVNRIVNGEALSDQMKSTQGHIVVRVRPGGDSYHVYILDDSTESFAVKAIHGPYESK